MTNQKSKNPIPHLCISAGLNTKQYLNSNSPNLKPNYLFASLEF